MPNEQPNLSRIYAWFGALVAEDYQLMTDLVTHGIPTDILHPLRQTTALMEATRLGRASSVKWLIEHGATPAFLCGTPTGSPLHCALQRKHWEIAKLLADAAENCEMVDGYGATPLHRLCAHAFSPEETEVTLELAATITNKSCPLDALDQEGATALHHCAVNNQLELATLLLRMGANPNVQIPGSEVSPLTIAALEKNMEMAKLLLEYGADPHVRSRDGTTPVALHPPVAQLVAEGRVPRRNLV